MSVQPLAAELASLIEKETEDSYDLYVVGLKVQGVCTRFNLIIFVLGIVLVLEIKILWVARDEYEDEDDDEVFTL